MGSRQSQVNQQYSSWKVALLEFGHDLLLVVAPPREELVCFLVLLLQLRTNLPRDIRSHPLLLCKLLAPFGHWLEPNLCKRGMHNGRLKWFARSCNTLEGIGLPQAYGLLKLKVPLHRNYICIKAVQADKAFIDPW